MRELLKKIPGAQELIWHVRTYRAPLWIRQQSKKRIKAFRNIHAGERCFVIGNGPSLTSDDLDKLKGEYCFAANRIYKIFDKTQWRPTYYCVQDMNVAEEMGDEFLLAAESAQATFLRMQAYGRVRKIYKKIKNVILVPILAIPIDLYTYKFSEDADKYINDGCTVTYMSMELAAYMGFKEIYLVGVDHSFPFVVDKSGTLHVVDKSQAAHFYETAADNEGENAHRRRTSMYDHVTGSYEAAEVYSRQSGKFRIYNATRGGKLEVFERVDLDEVLNSNGTD